MVGKMDNSGKENDKYKNIPGTNHQGNLPKKVKSKNNKDRGERRNTGQKRRKHFQKYHRRKFPDVGFSFCLL